MLDHFGFVLSKLVLLGLVFFQYRPRPAEQRLAGKNVFEMSGTSNLTQALCTQSLFSDPAPFVFIL